MLHEVLASSECSDVLLGGQNGSGDTFVEDSQRATLLLQYAQRGVCEVTLAMQHWGVFAKTQAISLDCSRLRSMFVDRAWRL